MRCKAAEKLMLAGEDRVLTAAERLAVENHLAACQACRELREARPRMRAALAGLWRAEPPDALSERTRRECLNAIRKPALPARVPASVIAASVVFSAATVVWIVLGLLGAGPVDTWTSLEALPVAAQVGLLLVAQNVFVLLLAPVILRRSHGDREGSENNGAHAPEIS